MNISWTIRVGVVFLLLLQVACGGNSGGGAKPSPPEIVSITPSNGSTNVSPQTTIEVVFSKDVHSMNPQAFMLTDETGSKIYTYNLTYSTDKYSYTLRPSQDLSPYCTYTLAISTDIADIAGNRLAAPMTIQFRTGASSNSPATPTGLKAIAGDGRVRLSWDPPAVKVEYYTIYRASAPGITQYNYQSLPDSANIEIYSSTTSTLLTGLTNGKTYYFVMVAYAYSANYTKVTSDNSSEVSATPMAGASMPNNSLVSNLTDTGATLTGTFTNPSGYTTSVWFEYGTTPAFGSSTTPVTYAQAGDVSVTADISGLTQVTTYHYRMVTQNSSGAWYGAAGTFRTLITPKIVVTANTLNGLFGFEGGFVYWIDTAWNIHKAPVSSGTGTTIASLWQFNMNPKAFEVRSGSVYWAEQSIYWNVRGSMKKVGTNGGPVSDVATFSLNEPPSRFFIDSTSIYYCDAAALLKTSISGGPTTTLATGCGGTVGVDATHIYWTDSAHINKTQISGSPPTIIIGSVSPNMTLPFVGNGFIYYADNCAIKKIAANGAGESTVVTIPNCSSSTYIISAMTADASNIYFIAGWSGRQGVFKVGIDGGDITQLGDASPYGSHRVIADSSNLYYMKGYDIVSVPINY